MKSKQALPKNIDEYIRNFPPDKQRLLKQIRASIKKAAPDAEEAIKYAIPTFVLRRNLVHFAAFNNHIGFFPTSSAIEKFKSELTSYKTARGSIQFPLDEPIPLELIDKIVKFRVAEVRVKSASKKK